MRATMVWNHASPVQRVPQMVVAYVVSLIRVSCSAVSFLVKARRGG